MGATPWANEERLLARLRAGDETAFAGLVDELHARLIAMARTFTSSPPLAEDIVQETWLAVIRGLSGFEGRSSLRSWIYGILVRRACTLAAKESKRPEVTAPPEVTEVEWEPGRGRLGLWKERPVPWGLQDPAAIFQTREALAVVRDALANLPPLQRQVVLLRDVEDLPATEVCNILGVSGTNVRVLLHRGRARIRRALDGYVRGQESRAGQPRDVAETASEPRSASAGARASEERHGMS